MTTTNLSVQWATWVSQSAPTAVYFGKTGYLSVNNTSSNYKFGYVYFTNPFPSSGANVSKATLTLRTRALAGSGTNNLSVKLATKYPVAISKMNWNTRGSDTGDSVSVTKSGPLANNAVWQFDVTALMQTVANGYGFNGFLIRTTNGKDINVQGNMSSALNPSLSVEWSQAPFIPEDLSPSTGAAVGTATPMLRWNYRDYTRGDVMASCRVQTATSSTGFASPVFDSGEVATVEPGLDLSTVSGYSAVAADTAVWWRVCVKDSTGLWSAWSDPVSFQFHARPTVTLSQPDPSGDGTFADPTPPIQWGYSGDMPQVRWRASVSILKGSKWIVVASSGIVVSAESSWTPTAGLASAGTVRIIVDVWDGRQREDVPGFPSYSSVSADFAFSPSSTVGAVTNLVVTPNPLVPAVTLSWGRSETADRFDVYRDGVLLSSHTGLDWSTGGESYSMGDNVSPGGPHTWAVYSIVNGKSSAATTVSATVDRPGSWLVDPDTLERVWIQGEQSHDMTMPEVTQTFQPFGSNSTVVVTTAQFGYEATLSGVLAHQPWLPDTESPILWRDRLLKWKADPGHDLYLLTEELAFPVNISEVTVSSTHPWVGERWNVSFKFHQTGGFVFGGS